MEQVIEARDLVVARLPAARIGGRPDLILLGHESSRRDCRLQLHLGHDLAGADGFIAKSSSKATMVKALQDILEGEVVIVSGEDVAEPVTLSPRQFATLELLASGLPNKEIAAHLDISPATAREHVSDLLGLLECDNRTQAVLKARRLGFILD